MIAAQRAFLEWLGAAALVVLGLAGLGSLLPVVQKTPGGTGMVLAACAVAVLGGLLGTLPVLRAMARHETGRMPVAMGWATALRAGSTLVFALVLVLGGVVADRRLFLVSLAVAYGLLLVVETRWALRWLSRAGSSQ